MVPLDQFTKACISWEQCAPPWWQQFHVFHTQMVLEPMGAIQGPFPIPRPGSDGSYGGDNHFQYINVPAHKTFEWGYRRGNPDHNREEYLSQKDHTFKAKLK